MKISHRRNFGDLSTRRSGSKDKLSVFKTQIDGLKKSIESINRGRFTGSLSQGINKQLIDKVKELNTFIVSIKSPNNVEKIEATQLVDDFFSCCEEKIISESQGKSDEKIMGKLARFYEEIMTNPNTGHIKTKLRYSYPNIESAQFGATIFKSDGANKLSSSIMNGLEKTTTAQEQKAKNKLQNALKAVQDLLTDLTELGSETDSLTSSDSNEDLIEIYLELLNDKPALYEAFKLELDNLKKEKNQLELRQKKELNLSDEDTERQIQILKRHIDEGDLLNKKFNDLQQRIEDALESK